MAASPDPNPGGSRRRGKEHHGDGVSTLKGQSHDQGSVNRGKLLSRRASPLETFGYRR